MQNYWNYMKSTSITFASSLTPVLKNSKFLETGNLTPDEFVVAGDFLIEISPSWKWCAGDEAERKVYLPKDKQFLITRRVPCYKRCKDIEYDNSKEFIIKRSEFMEDQHSKPSNSNYDEDWVDTHHNETQNTRPIEDLECGLDVLNASQEIVRDQIQENSKNKNADSESNSDSSEAVDLELCDDDDMLLEAQENIKDGGKKNAESKNGSQNIIENNFESLIEKTRTYDLHITYDKYYQTPRMWLSGYDEYDKPLTNSQTYQDISQDHVNKTVTFEPHTHLSNTQMCSIHPCKHANVIKKIMTAMEEGNAGNTMQVHIYMVVFLKFIQAAIPTIEYDFTRHVNLGN